jgi:hypothetical protein
MKDARGLDVTSDDATAVAAADALRRACCGSIKVSRPSSKP